MKVITYRLKTIEPLLATAIGGEPNSAVSFGYIPGSTVRGALISRHLKANNSTLDAGEEKTRRFFFDGSVRYLNAYPSDASGHRMLPVLYSWFCEKGQSSPVFDLSVEEEHALKQPKSAGQGFSRLVRNGNESSVIFRSAERRINVHTDRGDRNRGRSTEGEGALFRYEAIAPEESFIGVILCEKNEDASEVETMIKQSPEFLIGGSHNAGYGRVEVSILDSTSGSKWCEHGDTNNSHDETTITLSLLSDTIIRDTSGQPASEPDPADLVKALGAKELKLLRAFKKTGIAGGFNRKWGLPLPQVQVIKAGSVFVYQASGKINPEVLEWSGIGERRAEGFGRVAVNLNVAGEMKVSESKAFSDPVKTILSEAGRIVAQQMAARLLRKKLDQTVIARANSVSISGEIPNSQLSRCRAAARTALVDGNMDTFSKYLSEMQKTATRHFENTEVDGIPLKEWLLKAAEKPHDFFRDHFNEVISKQPIVAGVQADTKTVALEYTVRLIDGVLATASKRGGE